MFWVSVCAVMLWIGFNSTMCWSGSLGSRLGYILVVSVFAFVLGFTLISIMGVDLGEL